MFKNLSMESKLKLAFGMMGAIILIVALFGFFTANRLSGHIDTINKNSLLSVSALWRINEGQTQIESSERALLGTYLTMSERRAEITRMDNAWKQINEGFKMYEDAEKTSAELQAFQSFQRNWDNWKKLSEEFLSVNQKFETFGILNPFQVAPTSPNLVNTQRALQAYNELEKTAKQIDKASQSAMSDLLNLLRINEETAKKAEQAANQDIAQSNFWSLVAVIIGPVTAIIFAIFFTNTIAKPLGARIAGVVSAADKISQGDLTTAVDSTDQKDELGKLQNSFYTMNKDLNNLIRQIQRSGVQITTSATEIAASGKELEATVAEQLASTNEVTATAQQIATTAKQLVKTMEQVENLAQQTAVSASNSQGDLTQMEAVMRQLVEATKGITSKLGMMHDKANNINSVVTTITRVADQTNLLSLNAAIEAEKAGEYGAGFAVVAREIRRLADQTAVATLEIEQMVKEMQSAVSLGVMEMDKFNRSVKDSAEDVSKISDQIAEVIDQVQSLTPRFEQVSQKVEDQSEAASQISEAMSQLSQASQQTADALRETNRALEQLDEAAHGLRGEISRFKVMA